MGSRQELVHEKDVDPEPLIEIGLIEEVVDDTPGSVDEIG